MFFESIPFLELLSSLSPIVTIFIFQSYPYFLKHKDQQQQSKMEAFTKACGQETLFFVFYFQMDLVQTNHKMHFRFQELKCNQILYQFPFQENLRMEQIQCYQYLISYYILDKGEFVSLHSSPQIPKLQSHNLKLINQFEILINYQFFYVMDIREQLLTFQNPKLLCYQMLQSCILCEIQYHQLRNQQIIQHWELHYLESTIIRHLLSFPMQQYHQIYFVAQQYMDFLQYDLLLYVLQQYHNTQVFSDHNLQVKNDMANIKYLRICLTYAVKFLYYHKQMYQKFDLKQTSNHYAKICYLIFVILNSLIRSTLFISNLSLMCVQVNWSIIMMIRFRNIGIYTDPCSYLNQIYLKQFEYSHFIQFVFE